MTVRYEYVPSGDARPGDYLARSGLTPAPADGMHRVVHVQGLNIFTADEHDSPRAFRSSHHPYWVRKVTDSAPTDPRDQLWNAWDRWAEQIPRPDGSTSPTLSIPGQLAFELWGLVDRLRGERGDTDTVRRHPIPVGDLPADHSERLLDEALDALIWMSGSPSFGSGRTAGKRFDTTVRPLIDRLLERRDAQPQEEDAPPPPPPPPPPNHALPTRARNRGLGRRMAEALARRASRF
ncbi:MAG: hypothetical protein AAGA90_24045 [Actinomycetota bacterium]